MVQPVDLSSRILCNSNKPVFIQRSSSEKREKARAKFTCLRLFLAPHLPARSTDLPHKQLVGARCPVISYFGRKTENGKITLPADNCFNMC